MKFYVPVLVENITIFFNSFECNDEATAMVDREYEVSFALLFSQPKCSMNVHVIWFHTVGAAKLFLSCLLEASPLAKERPKTALVNNSPVPSVFYSKT